MSRRSPLPLAVKQAEMKRRAELAANKEDPAKRLKRKWALDNHKRALKAAIASDSRVAEYEFLRSVLRMYGPDSRMLSSLNGDFASEMHGNDRREAEREFRLSFIAKPRIGRLH